MAKKKFGPSTKDLIVALFNQAPTTEYNEEVCLLITPKALAAILDTLDDAE